jgi:hypothetical protein
MAHIIERPPTLNQKGVSEPVTKKKATDAQLRQMIRKIVREELQRMQGIGHSEWMEHESDFPRGKMAERPEPHESRGYPDPFDQGDLSPDHPPWASFGPLQPDPNRKHSQREEQPPRYPEWPGPYTPDLESSLGNPPYIPKRRK